MRPRGRRALAVAAALCCPAVLAGAVTTSTPSGSSGPDGPSGPGPTSVGAAGLAAPQTSSQGVEVSTHGVVTVHPYQQVDQAPVVLAVHAVQRVAGGTVVYYSVTGLEGGVEVGGLAELAAEQLGAEYIGGDVGSVRVVDHEGGQVYGTVLDPQSPSAIPSPFHSRYQALPTEAGVAGVLFAVLPELPASVERVDVDLLFGVTIPDVPVGEGLLEPALDPLAVIELGAGWPRVDEGTVRDVVSPDLYVYPLSSVVEALDQSQTVTETGVTVVIDVAADVLFGFDSADLTPQAQETLAQVAQRVVADGATGQVGVVGHTSSEGADDYNLDLSQRRAQAAASVLQPGLAGQGVTFSVEGRGEAEPVADNGSEQGRQLNRRVTITYTAGG